MQRAKRCTVMKRCAMELQSRSLVVCFMDSPADHPRSTVSHNLMSVIGSACCSFHPDIWCELHRRHLNRGLKYVEGHFPLTFILWFSLYNALCLLLWIFRFWFYQLLRNAALLCCPQRSVFMVLYNLYEARKHVGVHIYFMCDDETVWLTLYLQYKLHSSTGIGLLYAHVIKLGTLKINQTAI